MKITKTLFSVFLLTFLIGYASVLPIKKKSVQRAVPAAIQVNLSDPKIETKPDLETIEEVNSWGEEKYPFKIKLLETGEGFHGAEVKAKNGETWLGLFEEKGEFHLRFARLKIRPAVDVTSDDFETGKKTGKDVSVSGRRQPLFLLKNAAILNEGKVTTVFKGLTWEEYYKFEKENLPVGEALTFIEKGFTQTFEMADHNSTLKVIEAKNKENQKLLALTLESDGKRQILHTIYADAYPQLGTLYWVGDLDKDSKPDFYLELFESENVNNKVLFLSSTAEKDKLVKKVAYFWTTGC